MAAELVRPFLTWHMRAPKCIHASGIGNKQRQTQSMSHSRSEYKVLHKVKARAMEPHLRGHIGKAVDAYLRSGIPAHVPVQEWLHRQVV
eukprot:5073965-Amphidinium_carterae.3